MAMTSSGTTLNSVASIKATSERGVFILRCNITDAEGNTYDADYCSRPDDMFGLNPMVRKWLADNPSFPIRPYIPPTAAEVRASLPRLTARKLRVGLLRAGISPRQVTAAIDAMPASVDREKAQIEWEYATTFARADRIVATISTALGLSDAQIDAMWTDALNV
ncbi:hypothetical protein SJ05684_c20250 [Sinorhizobium sojae CCBAU 05684]|uniref:Uncharacterized protein n=1 Tax=Sinorhizobium sojae CCBAU 05684 TaxID=716928 RepID=A0A249PCN0_9HYPH|nr:hypothetical protein [Sinorhizobium sojae]ASY63467.1 hypothetical protein SJ05684_c20250 [Sinorhizobium sojae CCBAU 05684]